MLPIYASARGLGVARFWIFEVPCSSLTLPMFGTETRHCFERSFLVEFGMVFSWASLGCLSCLWFKDLQPAFSGFHPGCLEGS